MKADDTKSETLQFKVTEQERKLIERCAEEEATTVSKYVRGAVLMSMVMDGKAEAIKIVARGRRKAFGVVRQKLVRPTQEGR
ncbi:MAG: hypothetical protein IPO99_02040 [Nitrospira sp.]|nr:hypothetical protein [Nitrospira sp.]